MEVLNDLAPKNDTTATNLQAVCPVDYAFQRIGGKYKARIIWSLDYKTLRYGELRRRLADITPKMLTQVLRELESDGLINRKVYHEVPPKVEYSLTEDGAELVPFIKQVSKWATGQLEKSGTPIIEHVKVG